MLNPALDIAALASRYRQTGSVQIAQVLVPAYAERVLHCLARETPWSLVYNDGRETVTLSAAELRAMPPAEQERRFAGVHARAQTQYQFLYNIYPMVQNYRQGLDRNLLLHEVLGQLNAQPMLDFVRAVTSTNDLKQTYAQATLFAPGHFLRRHNDSDGGVTNRRVAYVLGFAAGWHPDWGGMLHFYNDDNDVLDVMIPHFNTLTLFSVPQPHAVSCVAPFAPVGRYAITGWFLDL
jgi:SM-20-related protein